MGSRASGEDDPGAWSLTSKNALSISVYMRLVLRLNSDLRKIREVSRGIPMGRSRGILELRHANYVF